MTALLAVDPGINGCGVAFFHKDRLLGCGLERVPDHGTITDRAARSASAALAFPRSKEWDSSTKRRVICEWPQIYTQGKRGGADPNDLLPLAAIAGALVTVYPVETVLPRVWKGQLKKNTCAIRIRSRLDAQECWKLDKALYHVTASLQHNIIDAVGIGLWACGRFQAIRVVSRGLNAEVDQ